MLFKQLTSNKTTVGPAGGLTMLGEMIRSWKYPVRLVIVNRVPIGASFLCTPSRFRWSMTLLSASDIASCSFACSAASNVFLRDDGKKASPCAPSDASGVWRGVWSGVKNHRMRASSGRSSSRR